MLQGIFLCQEDTQLLRFSGNGSPSGQKHSVHNGVLKQERGKVKFSIASRQILLALA